MGVPLSVSFSDIFMVKMENDVVIPSKPIFYCRFVDDILSTPKLGDNVLFDRLDNYHPNIKLTIEVNPRPPKFQNAINEIESMMIFIVQKEYLQTLTKKSL